MRGFSSCVIIFFIMTLSQAIFAQRCPSDPPALHVGTDGYKIVCELPGRIDFLITGYEQKQNREVIYYINFGDNTPIEGNIDVGKENFSYHLKITNDELKNKNGIITHSYNETYCIFEKTMWEIQVRAVSECNNTLFQIGSTSLLLQQKGTVDFETEPICDLKGCFKIVLKTLLHILVRRYNITFGILEMVVNYIIKLKML